MPDPSPNADNLQYRGRFAPSPTGPLHAGSVLAALASFLDARANNGLWYVRIEDLDPPRESPQAASQILTTLEALGLHWDGEIVYQSQRHHAYESALLQLHHKHLTFNCSCSRQALRSSSGSYPGRCRNKQLPASRNTATRCILPEQTLSFIDQLQGSCGQQLAQEVGDFIIKRKGGLYAYQLAVVVDDAWQGITHVVRGIDLLDSTPRQIYLQQELNYPVPTYSHLPVVTNAQQQKLSKQTHAPAVDDRQPAKLLYQALCRLQQLPEPALQEATVNDILHWATVHWNPQSMHLLQAIPEN